MKKILMFVFLLVSYSDIVLAQYQDEKIIKSKNEYIYFGVKLGALLNISKAPEQNNYVLMKTPYGDMIKSSVYPITFTPSGSFSLNIHFDSKKDRSGIVSGISLRQYSFTNIFKADSTNDKFRVKQTFSALSLIIPLYLKFNTVNIYRNQSYFTAGINYNLFIMHYQSQRANWNAQKYFAFLPKTDVRRSSLSFNLGVNYKIYYFTVDYIFVNFVNKKYQIQTEEGVISPYKSINFTNNLYFQFGINIPLTRWLSSRSWTAEKIRRFLKPKD